LGDQFIPANYGQDYWLTKTPEFQTIVTLSETTRFYLTLKALALTISKILFIQYRSKIIWFWHL